MAVVVVFWSDGSCASLNNRSTDIYKSSSCTSRSGGFCGVPTVSFSDTMIMIRFPASSICTWWFYY